jgi:hypothetical protein
MERPLSDYDFLRFDPNNTSNLHCAYCRYHRPDEVIDREQFRELRLHQLPRVY